MKNLIAKVAQSTDREATIEMQLADAILSFHRSRSCLKIEPGLHSSWHSGR